MNLEIVIVLLIGLAVPAGAMICFSYLGRDVDRLMAKRQIRKRTAGH